MLEFLCVFAVVVGSALCGGPAMISWSLKTCGSFNPLTWGAVITYIVMMGLWVLFFVMNRMFDRQSKTGTKYALIEKAMDAFERGGSVVKVLNWMLVFVTVFVVILTFGHTQIANLAVMFDSFRTESSELLHLLQHVGFVALGMSIAYLHMIVLGRAYQRKENSHTANS